MVTVSVGVASSSVADAVAELSAAELLAAADRALYAAKHGGRARVASAQAEADPAAPAGQRLRLP